VGIYKSELRSAMMDARDASASVGSPTWVFNDLFRAFGEGAWVCPSSGGGQGVECYGDLNAAAQPILRDFNQTALEASNIYSAFPSDR